MAFFHAKNCPERSRKSHVFLSTISRKTTAHRFSLAGYPGGVETVFSPKTNTFPDRRKEVIPWRYFAYRLFPQGDDSHCRGRLSGGGGQIPVPEAEQFSHRVCVGPYAGEHHLCPQHQEISAGCPV